jgi:hypothetical protein
MASSSASNSINPLLGQPVSEKLTKNNHAQWKAQIRAAVRGARLQGFLTGITRAPSCEITVQGEDGKEVKAPNPAFEEWEASN